MSRDCSGADLGAGRIWGMSNTGKLLIVLAILGGLFLSFIVLCVLLFLFAPLFLGGFGHSH